MHKSIFLSALLLLAPALSHAKTLEELLIEKGVISKAESSSITDVEESKVYWNRGTRIEFPDNGFTTTIATQIQSRYAFDDNQQVVDSQNTSGFSVTRARLIISGTALNREFSYKLQSDFVGTANDTESNRTASVRDAYIQWQPCENGGGVRMGQFKTQISRQFNTDQAALQFADRSVTSEYFTIGRQNGAMVFGSFADGAVYGSAGIYNGQSEGEGVNRPPVDTKHTGVASVRGNPYGKMNPYEEGDVDWTEEGAISLGAAYAYTGSNVGIDAEADSVESQILSVDANLKYIGWGANAEFFYQNYNGENFGTSEPVGFYAQSGYFLIPKKLEFAARYGYIHCDNGSAPGQCAGLDKLDEVSATINYFFWRHSLKAQLGYGVVNRELVDPAGGKDGDSRRWVFQVSSYF
jgi:hypothetical protein